MTAGDLVALAPWWVTAAAALAAVLVAAFTSSRRAALGTSLGGLVLAGGAVAWALRSAPREVPPLLVVDRFALLWAGLLLAAAFAVAVLAHGYLELRSREAPGELYALLLLATLGALVLPASDHFASLFLGLETLSVALYAMVGYFREDPRGVEAALKYLILAAASSAFLLFGMALVYAETGSLELAGIAGAAGAASPGALVLGGTALILVAVGFKLALVPFHLWTPDVYQGAPAPVTAFVATVSKGAVFALLLRWGLAFEGDAARGTLLALLGTVAVASMLAGNLLALLQDDVKRLLAYSSIAHLGYALVALLAGLAGGGALAVEGATFYLAAYGVTILGAFGVVAVLSGEDRDAGPLDDFRGLFWRRPALASLFTALLLSLAGIPLTAGFLAKFYALAAGVETALWLPVLVLIATSAVGLFYYLRVVVALFSVPDGPPLEGGAQPAAGAAAGATLAALAALLLWLGAWPEPVIRLIRAATTGIP